MPSMCNAANLRLPMWLLSIELSREDSDIISYVNSPYFRQRLLNREICMHVLPVTVVNI